MCSKPMKTAGNRCKNGTALVLILFVVLLLCAMILAYFARAQLQRQISLSSAGQARAELLARTATAIITGELLEEIRAGSTVHTVNGVPIYLPESNFSAFPQHIGNNGITNLVKISTAASPPWRSTADAVYSMPGILRAASGNSTANKSHNGRSITLQRWLRPNLLTFAESSGMPSPDWIIMTREGPATAASLPSLAELADQSAANTKCAIGRYAYAIYDVSGLLDITVAGYSSRSGGPTADEIGRKGLLAMADLT